MKKIDTVIGIAGGAGKAEVIHAALCGNNINVLISDTQTAEKVLNF